MSERAIHLPGTSYRWAGARPACGVRHGYMSGEVVGLRTGVLFDDVETLRVDGVFQGGVTCETCIDAMMRGNPRVTRTGSRWANWLLATRYGSREGAADGGSSYRLRMTPDSDREREE